jgi:hypothetical protein
MCDNITFCDTETKTKEIIQDTYTTDILYFI